MEGTKSVTISSDELPEVLCEPCGRSKNADGEANVAEWFCVDCSEYLCGHCVDYHKKFKQFQHHVLQDKDNIGKFKDVCVSKCSAHIDKVIEYVCHSCDKYGCNVCMTIDHRSCEKVRFIPDEVKGSDAHGEVQEFAKKLDNMDKNLQELQDQIDKNSKVSVDMNKTAQDDLDQRNQQICTFFRGLYDEIKLEIQEKLNKDTSVFQDCLSEINHLQTQLHEVKARLVTLDHGNQKCELFIFMKDMKTTLEKMTSGLEKLSENGKKSAVRYEPSSELEEIMKDEIKNLGRLVIGEVDQKTSIKVESKKKTMEKELDMLRRENKDNKDELQRKQAFNKTLEKEKADLSALLLKVKQENNDLTSKNEELEREKSPYEGCCDHDEDIHDEDIHDEDIHDEDMSKQARRTYDYLSVDDYGRMFTSINASWPGSCHDSHVFRTPGLCRKLETENRTFGEGVLLGDSGYPCRPFLMTPFLVTDTAGKTRYQESHTKTRVVIERTFGQLKRRFHVFHSEIRLIPQKGCKITMACAILHNLAHMLNEPDVEFEGEEGIDFDNGGSQDLVRDGATVRNFVVQQYFL